MDADWRRGVGEVGQFDLSVFWAGAVRFQLIYYLRLIITSIIFVPLRLSTPISQLLAISPLEIHRNTQTFKVVKAQRIFWMYNI